MIVNDGDDFLALVVLVAGIAAAIAPFLATVLVPSPWSTLRSSCFSTARCRTLATNAWQSEPSSAHRALDRHASEVHCWPFLPALPKSGGLPLLTRLQSRACAFPFTRLLSGAAPVMSTIQPTGLGDALSALHTYLGTAGFMSYACLLAPLPSTPPLPRQPILGITPGLRFLGDPSS